MKKYMLRSVLSIIAAALLLTAFAACKGKSAENGGSGPDASQAGSVESTVGENSSVGADSSNNGSVASTGSNRGSSGFKTGDDVMIDVGELDGPASKNPSKTSGQVSSRKQTGSSSSGNSTGKPSSSSKPENSSSSKPASSGNNSGWTGDYIIKK